MAVAAQDEEEEVGALDVGGDGVLDVECFGLGLKPTEVRRLTLVL